MLQSGVESTHPPPPPSGTPETQSDVPPQESHKQGQRRNILGGGRAAGSLSTEGGIRNAVTEGFAIEESEAEEPHHSRILGEGSASFAESEKKEVGEEKVEK